MSKANDFPEVAEQIKNEIESKTGDFSTMDKLIREINRKMIERYDTWMHDALATEIGTTDLEVLKPLFDSEELRFGYDSDTNELFLEHNGLIFSRLPITKFEYELYFAQHVVSEV